MDRERSSSEGCGSIPLTAAIEESLVKSGLRSYGPWWCSETYLNIKIMTTSDNEELGFNEGEVCNRNGCDGIISRLNNGSCSCSTSSNPPCSYCTDFDVYCPDCEWENFYV